MANTITVNKRGRLDKLLLIISLSALVYWVYSLLFNPYDYTITLFLYKLLYYPMWIIVALLPFTIIVQGILKGFRSWHLLLSIVIWTAAAVVLYYGNQPIIDWMLRTTPNFAKAGHLYYISTTNQDSAAACRLKDSNIDYPALRKAAGPLGVMFR